jgi:hypothetical protein
MPFVEVVTSLTLLMSAFSATYQALTYRSHVFTSGCCGHHMVELQTLSAGNALPPHDQGKLHAVSDGDVGPGACQIPERG